MTAPDADPLSLSWLRIILAFVVVGGLLALLGWGLKYLSLRGVTMPGRTGGQQRRLQLVETLPIDARRRLAIIRCDGAEYLLLLGANQDIVVSSRLESLPQSVSES